MGILFVILVRHQAVHQLMNHVSKICYKAYVFKYFLRFLIVKVSPIDFKMVCVFDFRTNIFFQILGLYSDDGLNIF